jgi:hypothetical protein
MAGHTTIRSVEVVAPRTTTTCLNDVNGSISDRPPPINDKHSETRAFVIHDAGGPEVPTFLPRRIGMNESMIVLFVGYMIEGMDQPKESTQHSSMTFKPKLSLVCKSLA